MREKEEEDITQQKVPLYTRCSQLTSILIPMQHTCVIIRTSLRQPSLELTCLPTAKHSRTRCCHSRRTVPMLESNNQTQSLPSNQTYCVPRLANSCVVIPLTCRIAHLFASTYRLLSLLPTHQIGHRIPCWISLEYPDSALDYWSDSLSECSLDTCQIATQIARRTTRRSARRTAWWTICRIARRKGRRFACQWLSIWLACRNDRHIRMTCQTPRRLSQQFAPLNARQIASCIACQRLSKCFAQHNNRRIAHRIAHRFGSSTPITTVGTPQCMSNSKSDRSLMAITSVCVPQ